MQSHRTNGRRARRSRWLAPCCALAIPLLAGGCDNLFGLQHIDPPAPDVPPGKPNVYTCSCSCKGGAITITRQTCLGADLNPALPGSTVDPSSTPSADQLQSDCADRVGANVEQLGKQCIANNFKCTCDASADLTYAAECDTPCAAEDLASDCSNFDPANHVKTATNVAGHAPVCFTASSDPPTPTPDPLAAGLFGNESWCDVSGQVSVAHGGDPVATNATGVVRVNGDPCPGATCDVGMAYRLDDIDDIELGGFTGFDSVVFEDIVAGGASLPLAATLGPDGIGAFAESTTMSSGKGKRSNQLAGYEYSSDVGAYTGTNGAPIGVLVDWAGHACALSGTVLGSVEDTSTTVSVDLAGTIANEPPRADAGADATVECTSPAGATVHLDGSASTDPESDIALYVWRSGTRTGTELAETAAVDVPQALGPATYFLQVVDAFGQGSQVEKQVTVADTTPPAITSLAATPNVLAPTDHKMALVNVSVSATDVCGASSCRIVQVTANQPIDASGDGRTSPDVQLAGDLSVYLRRERTPLSSPRVYHIDVACTDDAGNGSTRTVDVTVPLTSSAGR